MKRELRLDVCLVSIAVVMLAAGAAARADGPGTSTRSTGTIGFFKHLFHLNRSEVPSVVPAIPVTPTNTSSTGTEMTPVPVPVPVINNATLALPSVIPAAKQTPVNIPEPELTGRNLAILFGGADINLSGAGIPTTNQFQQDFISLAKALKSHGWDVEPLFGNGGACSNCSGTWSVDPIALAVGKASSEIPRASKAELIHKLDFAIQTLSKGDQLLIEINTHGGLTSELKASASSIYPHTGSPSYHSDDYLDTVSLSVDDDARPYGEGDMIIDDSELTRRYQTLRDQGVKIAFGNDSCYGGPAAQRLRDYGCVVTATSKKYDAGSPVSQSLVDLLTFSGTASNSLALVDGRNMTMEDVYLDVIAHAPEGTLSSWSSGQKVWLEPYDGLLQSQSSADLDQYEAAGKLGEVSNWLQQFKSNYLDVQNGQMTSLATATDFSVLQDYVQQYVAPSIHAEQELRDQSIARAYLTRQTFIPIDPADIVAPSELLARVMNASSELQSSMQSDADQYNRMALDENDTREKLKQNGFQVNVKLPDSIGDSEQSFEQAVHALDGNQLHVVGGWLLRPVAYSDVSGSHLQALFSPTHPVFKTSVDYIVMDLAAKMASTYPKAESKTFQTTLSSAIQKAETEAWNSASPENRSLLQKVEDLYEQRTKLITQGTKPGPRYMTYIMLARLYAYLERRENLQRSNTDLNRCSDFILRPLL